MYIWNNVKIINDINFSNKKIYFLWAQLINYFDPGILTRFLCRAGHLFFPQLGSRTTIKQYGLVRNRNLLGYDNDMLPFSIKKNLGNCISVCLIFISRLLCLKHTAPCKSLVFFSRSCVFYFCLSILTSQGPGIHFKGWTLNILIQNIERSRMYSLYSPHVMSRHCWFSSQLAWGTNQTVDLFESFNPAWSSKVFYNKLITNSMTGIVVVPCVHLAVPNDVTALTL